MHFQPTLVINVRVSILRRRIKLFVMQKSHTLYSFLHIRFPEHAMSVPFHHTQRPFARPEQQLAAVVRIIDVIRPRIRDIQIEHLLRRIQIHILHDVALLKLKRLLALIRFEHAGFVDRHPLLSRRRRPRRLLRQVLRLLERRLGLLIRDALRRHAIARDFILFRALAHVAFDRALARLGGELRRGAFFRRAAADIDVVDTIPVRRRRWEPRRAFDRRRGRRE
mmetsp:Transcript_45/g.108  ORF Transcript_45/g.108 Transcript_45/m.108 type:complete len:223 (-) Transcript_45:68-736(-)